jgi:hypothetical protein
MIVLFGIVFVLAFLLVVLSEFTQRNGVLNAINYSLNFLLLFIIIGSATFNNDWIAYEESFEGFKPTRDLLYYLGFLFFRTYGFSFSDFYLWNQVLIYTLVLFFISRFTNKYLFWVVLAILVIACPNLSILLRYYTAFSFFLLAVYILKVTKNRLMGYTLLCLAFLSHFGTIILLGVFLVFRYFSIERSIKPVLAIAFVLWFFREILFGLLIALGIGSFSIYIEDEASLKGGVLASLPYLPWMFFVYLIHSSLRKKNSKIGQDTKYTLLYMLSLFPFFFIILGFFTQIILHRYIEPFIILWCTYLCYSIRYEMIKINRLFISFSIFILIIVSFYFKYFLPLAILGFSEWLMHYLQILNSNAFHIFQISNY